MQMINIKTQSPYTWTFCHSLMQTISIIIVYFYNTQHNTEKAILLCAVWVFLHSDILFIPTIIILRHVCHADAEMKHNETKYEHTCKVWVVAQKQQFELTISHTALHEHQTHIHSHVHMLFVYCTHHTNTHTHWNVIE